MIVSRRLNRFLLLCCGYVMFALVWFVPSAELGAVTTCIGPTNTKLPRGSSHPRFTLSFDIIDQVSGTNGIPTACMSTTALRGDANNPHEFIRNQSPFLTQGSWYSLREVHWQLPQVVTDGTHNYYHLIVGSEAEGFIQETYIRMGFFIDFQGAYNPYGPAKSIMTWKFAALIPDGAWGSASGGSPTVDLTSTNPRWLTNHVNNAFYPLQGENGVDDGNGSGNPNMVMTRQLLDVAEIRQDFVKASFTRKPKITQNIRAADMTANTVIDMTRSVYSSMTPGTFNHSQRIIAPPNELPAGSEHFDFATDRDQRRLDVDAGAYTYNDDPRVATGPGQSGGTYNYASGSFDIEAVDWSIYFDHSQANPWSYPNHRPQP